MAGSKNGYGAARTILIVLAALLAVGIAGSFWMGARARGAARDATVDQASAIAQRSLTLVFKPEDLTQPVGESRASQLSHDVTAVVLDPSDFTGVTLWSADGAILYSTETGRIGNQLPGERTRIRAAIKGNPQTEEADGLLSVMVPLTFRSGAGDEAAVELTRPDTQIAAAAGPWRTIAIFLGAALALLGLAIFGVGRLNAALGTLTSFPRPGTREDAARPQSVPVVDPLRRLHVPTPGLREEADARRIAEERARAAEERLAVMQDQYRNTLEDLRTMQRQARESSGQAVTSDPRLEERALRAEGTVRTLEDQVRALTSERERLATRLNEMTRLAETIPQRDPELEQGLREAEHEAMGLRAELEGAHTQLSVALRDAQTLRVQLERASAVQEDLDAAHIDLRHTREALDSTREDVRSGQAELEDARAELRVLRGEEQRAAMLEDELRAARSEVQGLAASQRAELVEREADFEEKVRATREQFQLELAQIEASNRELLARKEAEFGRAIQRVETEAGTTGQELITTQAELEVVRAELTAGREELAAASEELVRRQREIHTLQAELGDRGMEIAGELAELDAARAELATGRAELASLRQELGTASDSIALLHAELAAAQDGDVELAERTERAERDNRALAQRLDRLAAELEDAGSENAELNRKLQELEARRALEIANVEGRANLDDLLRVTQERLAGQTEKLIAAEDRVHELEREVGIAAERIEEAEGEIRHHQMAEALREIKEVHEPQETEERGSAADGLPFEDRRASSPFLQELSLDARKSLTRILGITQILKYKKDAKDQAQLIKQLTAYARRLDHTVTDLGEADRLAHGEMDLQVKRTNLEALVQRVVEESGVGAEHEIQVETESLVIGIDQLRTEQILSNLLRNSSDRTSGGKSITVRLKHVDGGAVISVEDPEPSSDASLSPVVKRFAEAQGGWAKVEGRESGGSVFRVYLPDGAPIDAAESRQDVQILVPEGQEWEPTAEQILVQELHRLSELD